MKRVLFFMIALALSRPVFAQETDLPEEDQPRPGRKSKFLTGLFIGSYFANKYSADMYNGYGFDIEGNRNIFTNSFMYQKIKNEYGGGYGQYDYIADAIGVDRGQWEFNESDMPTNMRYVPAVMVGFNFKIPTSARSSVLVNINASKLSIEGNFTMTTLRPGNTNPALNNNIKTFAIRGREQRMIFQLGFQKLVGGDDVFNFLIEGGLTGTLTKFDGNTIYINTLQIDLTYYVNQTLNPAPFPTKRPIGFGVGAFAGLGINIDVSKKFNAQILYQPSLEMVNMGIDPKRKVQNALGLRFYYKF